MKGEITEVHVELCKWGRWALRCESGALGFASACSLGYDGDQHLNQDGYHSAIPRGVVLDDDMEKLDGMIRMLPNEPLPLQRSVIEFYKFGSGKSLRAVAAVMEIHHETLTKYLVEAQRKIAIDISEQNRQNPLQSANGGKSLQTTKPVPARA